MEQRQTTHHDTAHDAVYDAVYDAVSFRLADKTYALPLSTVAQIIPMVTITPLPHAPDAVEGVMNFRGDAVPVIDLRRCLGMPETSLNLHTPIILAMVQGRTLGLIVDEVLGIVSVPRERVAALDDVLPQGLGDVPLLDGLIHMQDVTMLLLDLAHLFSPDQARELARVIETLPDDLADVNEAVPALAATE
jgi:purine-binding chemotaxis protein CheW